MLALLIVAGLFFKPSHAAAYSNDHLIDDSIFLNAQSWSPGQIQNFLNQRGSGLAGLTVTERSNTETLSYYPHYNQTVSVAQAIYDAAQVYGINPQVILATMQKEQSLMTDPAPTSNQLRFAMGYGCPDSAGCSDASAGLFYQIDNGTWDLRFLMERARGNNSYWNASLSYPCRNTTQYYSPGLFPGNNVTFIDDNGTAYTQFVIATSATASLYCYTPHAYNNPSGVYGNPQYGTVGLYYSGSYNFVTFFEKYFGSTISGEFTWRVIQAPNDSRLFLQVANTKRWIPTGEIYGAWGLQNYAINQVSQAEFDAIPTIPELGHVGDNGQYHYLVDGGRKHYIPDSYLSLWGYGSPYISAPVASLLRTLPESEPAGRFISNGDNPGSLWLINAGTKQLISSADAANWGYSPTTNLTGITTSYLNTIPNGPSVGSFINYGGTDYLVSNGARLSFKDMPARNVWSGQTFVSISASAPSLLPLGQRMGNVARSSTVNQWFYLEGGKKHYITSASLGMWGISPSEVITINSDLLSKLSAGNALTNLAKDASDQKVYLVDSGKKYYLSSSGVQDAWLPQGTTPQNVEAFETSSLNRLSIQSSPSLVVQPTNEGHIYAVMNGQKYHLSSWALVNAWGVSHKWPVQSISPGLASQLPTAGFAPPKVTDGTNTYLLDNGYKRLIPSALSGVWNSSSAMSVSVNLLALFDNGLDLTSTVSIGGTPYMIDAGYKLPLGGYASAYGASSPSSTISSDTLPSRPTASYLARSSNTQNSNVWLISSGKKYLLPRFESYVSYGYLSRGVPITSLSDALLNTIPDGPETPGLFIRPANSYGVKFLNFGYSLGFPDGDTLTRYLGSSPVLVVSDDVYNSFPLVGSVSKIIRDDSGKIYLMQGGQRHWLTNYYAYAPYASLPVGYLYGTTMALIPEGSAIN